MRSSDLRILSKFEIQIPHESTEDLNISSDSQCPFNFFKTAVNYVINQAVN